MHPGYRMAVLLLYRRRSPGVSPGRKGKGERQNEAMPLYRWDEIALEKVTEMVSRKVVRGERDVGTIPDLPDRLVDWEPDYPLATYKADKWCNCPSLSPARIASRQIGGSQATAMRRRGVEDGKS